MNSPTNGVEEVKRELGHENSYIFVKSGKIMEKVCYRDVLYIESFRDFVKIHLVNRVVTTYLKISYLEVKLPTSLFERVHKSYIVAIKKIDAYSMSEIEIGGKVIPIGNFYKKQVLERMGNQGKNL